MHISLALLAVGMALAGDRDSAEAERNAKVRKQKILAEIQRLGDHEWAGEYYAGDGLGVNTTIVVAPNSGYVFEWHGCLGLYDRNYGTVASTNGRIRMSFTFENKRKGFQGMAPEFIPVAWSSRRYLVPADGIVGFCNHVNNGSEPRDGAHGFHLLRKGDEKKEVTGDPKLPYEYHSYLLAKPIEATIIAVGTYTTRPSLADWKFKDTPVTIDAGTNKGVRAGMELLVTQPRGMVESVRITKAEADRSEGVVTQVGEKEQSPKVGWRLSTQAPWRTGRRNR